MNSVSSKQRRSHMRHFPVRLPQALALLLFFALGCGQAAKPGSRESVDQSSEPPAGENIWVAAASDLRFAMEEILSEFRRLHPEIQVEVTYGSSGNFYTQLSNQAPYCVYLSADIDYPRKLIEQGLAEKETEFAYGIGHLVVWIPNESKLDVERGMELLSDPAIRNIAIANPKHAPYGRAAEAALKKSGHYEHVKSRLVLGDSISQTAQFVQTGAADVGLIALSLALSPAMTDKGRFWKVPQEMYPPLIQGGIIMKSAKSPKAAQAYRKFLIGEAGQAILKKYGFDSPDK
ncbi:MAG: molybdate ABC transporter substrate-binding protein [Planctomycetota bacterium]